MINCQLHMNLISIHHHQSLHQPPFPLSGEVSATDPLPGGGEDHPVIVDVDDLNESNGVVGREGSATSHAETVEIRFEEPEVIASDTGANRAEEDIPVDVGGNFG